jgi:hypothetical protein
MKSEPVLLLAIVAATTEAGSALMLLAADHTTAGAARGGRDVPDRHGRRSGAVTCHTTIEGEVMFAATHHSTDELITVLGLVLVFACLGGAAYLAYLSNAVGAVLLLLVAIVAAYLLLL